MLIPGRSPLATASSGFMLLPAFHIVVNASVSRTARKASSSAPVSVRSGTEAATPYVSRMAWAAAKRATASSGELGVGCREAFEAFGQTAVVT